MPQPHADPVLFADREDFRAWLAEHHDIETELWLLIRKKGSPLDGLRYTEAVMEALAWGWIDGTMHAVDGDSFAQRFTPRKPNSVWSKTNVERVERLTAEGLMAPAGMAAVEAGKASGAWQKAYSVDTPVEMPDHLEHALRDAGAWEAWEAFPPHARNDYTGWVVRAKKQETRERRAAVVVERTLAGKKPGVP